MIYRMLKKVKYKGIANHLVKIFLITFSFVVTVIAVPSAFFPPVQALKPFADSTPFFSSLLTILSSVNSMSRLNVICTCLI